MKGDSNVSASAVSSDTLVEIYRRAILINRSDAKFRTLLQSGALRVVYYPVRGQEVLAAAAMTALDKDDYLVTTYRGLHDHLAKGIPLRSLWAEFAGKASGTCKGKGGPMHITDPNSGVMVTTGIVGSGLPIANGLALSSVLKNERRVTIVSFGDGASNIGAFHEALNLASIWKLPVIFLCQNNRYAEHTPYAHGTAAKQVVDRAPSYDMAAVRVDGNDAEAMYHAVREAADRARAGSGPTLMEAMVYRMLGHTNGTNVSYVPKAYFEEAKAADPLPRLRELLLRRGVRSETLSDMNAAADAEVEDAAQFALSAEYPDVDEIRRDVLKSEIRAW